MRNVECGMSERTSLGARPSLAIPHSAFPIPRSEGWGSEVLRDHRNPVRRRGRGSHAGPRWGGGPRGASRRRAGDAAVSPARGGRVVDGRRSSGRRDRPLDAGGGGGAHRRRGRGRAHAPDPGADRAAPGARGVGDRAGAHARPRGSGCRDRGPARRGGYRARGGGGDEDGKPAARAARGRRREGARRGGSGGRKRGAARHRRKRGTLRLTGPYGPWYSSRLMKTFTLKSADIDRRWFVVDAAGQPLGRLASRVAQILRGKHKPTFTPHVNGGDCVIVVNAERVGLTGRKLDQKQYFHHTGYMGHERFTPLKTMLAKHPERVIEKAVWGMLPKTTLSRQKVKQMLKVYAGPTHPHAAQQPQPLAIAEAG